MVSQSLIDTNPLQENLEWLAPESQSVVNSGHHASAMLAAVVILLPTFCPQNLWWNFRLGIQHLILLLELRSVH